MLAFTANLPLWCAELDVAAVAKAQLRAIDQPTALRILHALAHYLETAEGDVKHLQNIEPPEFWLRVGDYRVRFHDQGNTIRIP